MPTSPEKTGEGSYLRGSTGKGAVLLRQTEKKLDTREERLRSQKMRTDRQRLRENPDWVSQLGEELELEQLRSPASQTSEEQERASSVSSESRRLTTFLPERLPVLGQVSGRRQWASRDNNYLRWIKDTFIKAEMKGSFNIGLHMLAILLKGLFLSTYSYHRAPRGSIGIGSSTPLWHSNLQAHI